MTGDHRTFRSRGFRLVWSAVAVIALATVLLEGDRAPRLAGVIVLVMSIGGLVTTFSRRSVVAAATCPDDGQQLEIQLRNWGPRAVPLLRCSADGRNYYVSSWSPLELTLVDLDDR